MDMIAAVQRAWVTTRAKRDHLRRHQECAHCGIKAMLLRVRLEVHHVIPVHVRPDLAAESTNLVTLCAACHWHIGHLGNWNGWNSKLLETISAMNQSWRESQKRELHS